MYDYLTISYVVVLALIKMDAFAAAGQDDDKDTKVNKSTPNRRRRELEEERPENVCKTNIYIYF